MTAVQILLVLAIILFVLAAVGIPPLPRSGRNKPVHIGWAGVAVLAIALLVVEVG